MNTNLLQFDVAGTGQAGIYICRFRVRVAVATGGIDNAINFCVSTINPTVGDPLLRPVPRLRAIGVEVNRYNDTLSYDDDGTNDKLIIESSNKNIVEY